MYKRNFEKSARVEKSSSLGKVKSFSKNINSSLEPVELFAGLSSQLSLSNNMLLESSEIDSKENVKSILMLKAALRIECNGTQVVIQSLTANGKAVIELIAAPIKSTPYLKCICHEKAVIAVEVDTQIDALDEDSRLKRPSPIDILRAIKQGFKTQSDSDFSVFLCGLFSFDFIATFEDLQKVSRGKNTCPDFVFYLAETLLVVDHQRNSKRLVTNQFIEQETKDTVYYQLAREFEQMEEAIAALEGSQLNSNANLLTPEQLDDEVVLEELSLAEEDIDDASYENTVGQLKENIINGDIFQVVPSRTFSIRCASPIQSYQRLKATNPSPYMFYMQDQDFSLFGASPESALKYTSRDNNVLLYPIAGTRPRGKNDDGSINLDFDARIEAELKLDTKEVAEHMMLVDLARNDIARIAEPGTTHVPRLLAVDRYSQVMHLVSCVQGQLRSDLDALHAYQACMNMGTLTGAPKIKATQLIREVEGVSRGSYGGAVGYLNGNGDMDTCIVIRSAFYKDGFAHIQAGAGVVYDSVPKLEAEETRNKAKAVINAVLDANKSIIESGTKTKSEKDSTND